MISNCLACYKTNIVNLRLKSGGAEYRKLNKVRNEEIKYLAVSEVCSPCIFMSGREENIGIITNCNKSVSRVFGYLKEQLIGQSVNILIPEIIKESHQKMLENYIEKSNTSLRQPSIFNSDKIMFGKHKSGYIFPFKMRIVGTPSLLNDSNFIALINIETKMLAPEIFYLLLDQNRNISDISASNYLLLVVIFI